MSWSSVICHSKNEKVLFFSLCVCPCVLLLQPYCDLLSLLLLESLHCGVQLSCLLLFSLINNLTNLILYFCMLCFKQERTSVEKKRDLFWNIECEATKSSWWLQVDSSDQKWTASFRIWQSLAFSNKHHHTLFDRRSVKIWCKICGECFLRAIPKRTALLHCSLTRAPICFA